VVQCGAPALSRIPMHYVLDAAYANLVRWLDTSVAPPHAPMFQLISTTPPSASTDSYGPDLARDSDGNALGAIRLADEQVPVATNTGSNFGPALCFLNGTYIPFTEAHLQQLYPTHQDYLSEFAAAALAVYKQGFILQGDLTQDVDAAAAASVP